MESIFSVGITAPEVVVALANSNPEISGLHFQECRHLATVTDDLKAGNEVPVGKMLRSNPDPEKEIYLKREQITIGRLRYRIKHLPQDRILIVNSRISLSSGEEKESDVLNIPMIDFNCPISQKSLVEVRSFLKLTGQKGVILESGKSYHFYGMGLLHGLGELMGYFGNLNLFNTHTDQRWIGHQERVRSCSLRISPGKEKPMPKVVAIVE